MERKRVLVLSPHADDAELGVGGYLARVVDAGGEVMVVLATAGTSRSLNLGRVVGERERLNEFLESMSVLGVQATEVLTTGFDGALDTVPRAQMIHRLDMLQNRFEPDEVLIPLASSHQDHRYCWEVGLAATRPSRAKHAPGLVAAYEYPATCWGGGGIVDVAGGTLYIDVSATWQRKIDALRRHVSQIHEGAGHLVGVAGVTALAQWRGAESGFALAEVLHVLRMRWGD